MPAFGDENVLAEKSAKGDETAMVQLTNLGLSRVIAAAKGYVGRGVLLLDLIQEGSLGLWQSVQNYRSGPFEPYSDRWIHFYMAKAVLLQAEESGLGQKMRRAMEDYRSVDERLLAELAVASARPEHPDEQVSPEIRFLNEATAIIERHIDDGDWSIEDFASEMCLSHTSLFQRMKSVVGLSPVEFIREVRLKRACQLIDEGNHNITSISYMVGFSDPKYFTRVFKKRFGVPPSQYGEQTLE